MDELYPDRGASRRRFGCATLSCTEQFRAMAFAQLTYRESLRDIEACLLVQSVQAVSHGLSRRWSGAPRWPMPTRGAIGASGPTWRQCSIRRARKLYTQRQLRASSWPTLSMRWIPPPSTCACRCFPGRRFVRPRRRSRCIRCWICAAAFPPSSISATARLHDVNVLDILPVEAGAFYVMDRGYVDFARLYTLHQAGAFFVTRAKSEHECTPRVFDARPTGATGVICDQTHRAQWLLYVPRTTPSSCGASVSRIRSPARRWCS